MSVPAACLDECTDLHLMSALQARGYDVTSLQVIGPRGMDDGTVLRRTTGLGRILITHNAADFRRLDAEFRRQGRPHGGIICLPQSRLGPFSRLELRAAMMLDWVGMQPYASRFFRWGQLQQQLEGGFQLPSYGPEDVQHALGRS